MCLICHYVTETVITSNIITGMAGYGVQMPQLGQMQYQHHCCATETVAETEVDSSRFLSAILGTSQQQLVVR